MRFRGFSCAVALAAVLVSGAVATAEEAKK
jgi:hypothetical protein